MSKQDENIKHIRCPKCGEKPIVQIIRDPNRLTGIWCFECGLSDMDILLEAPKTSYEEQERRKVERKKAKKRAPKFDRSRGVKLTDLPLAIRKKLGYPDG